MLQIPQHLRDGTLVDLNQLLPIVERHLQVDSWMIEVEECIRSVSDGIEFLEISVSTLKHHELVILYKDVYQTIDGIFTGFTASKEVVNLIAIGSTCWEISSVELTLLDDMTNKFGTYPENI